MKQKKKIAFIAHYVETWNWLLNFKIFGFLHKHPHWNVFLFPLFPICWIVGVFYLFRQKPFRVVDEYDVNHELKGYTILIYNFGWHFLFLNQYEKMRQRILQATLYAQNELKVDVVGLGALTKAETLTEGGLWLTKQDGVSVPIVHGDTCTAWFVIERLVEIYNHYGKERPILLLGPTSKIGRAIILELVPKGFEIYAYTDSFERFSEIQSELPTSFKGKLVFVNDLRKAGDCRVWVTGKFKPSGKKLLQYLPKGTVLLNFAVPDPLQKADLNSRPDLLHFDGGLVELPKTCNMKFMMRLKPNITYACAAGTMVHAFRGWNHCEVRDVKMNELKKMKDACVELDLKLAKPTSHLRDLKET